MKETQISIKQLIENNIFNAGLSTCLQEILEIIEKKKRQCDTLMCINPHSYVTAKADPSFMTALESANWLIPDGIGMILSAKILNTNVPIRLTGPDLFYATMAQLNIIGGSVFFLGSSEKTLSKIRAKILVDYPNIQLCGTYSPPFKKAFDINDNRLILRAINNAAPDVLWVGLTAPKQEKWLHENRKKLKVSFAGGIGAAFDFYAGTIPRAPNFIRKIGLEWLYRFCMSPIRLGARNLISGPKFLIEIVILKIFIKLSKNTDR